MATLYVIGTPIGNMEDITLRALRIFNEVGLILCEDTRVTQKLLNHHKIAYGATYRLDANVEEEMIGKINELFEEWKDIALVTDAGTPGISDPGSRFIKAAREVGVTVISVPGPSALSAAISISGLNIADFIFLGFLPHKKGRETLFKEIATSARTVIFYESTHRLLKTLEKLEEAVEPTRKVVVAKELTKMFEEIVSGSAEEVFTYFKDNEVKQKGEFVVMVEARK